MVEDGFRRARLCEVTGVACIAWSLTLGNKSGCVKLNRLFWL